MQDAARATPWVLTTYFAEGLPYSIVHQVSAEMFTSLGASLAAVGYTSLYGLLWNLKFLWSPFVGGLGSLRFWIVGMEVLLAISMLVIAGRADTGGLVTAAIVLVPISLFAATQDIAVDGYYLAGLEKQAQMTLSGPRVAAYRVALLVGKSGLVWLAGTTSWAVCFAAAAAMMVVLAIYHRFALAPLRAGLPPKVTGRRVLITAFAASFWTFLKKPKIAATLGFILTFRAGDAFMFNMGAPFLQDLGQDLAARGQLSAPTTVASIGGSIVGGVVIRAFSFRRTLFPIAFVQAIAIPIYVWLAIARPSFWVIALVVSLEQFVAGIGIAALLVFLMKVSEGKEKTAHFAICTALMSVPTTLAGLVSGDLAKSLGFASFFLLCFVLAVPGVLLSRMVPKGT